MIANYFKKTKLINSFFIGVLFLVYYILFFTLIDTTPFSFLEAIKKIGLLLLFLTLFFLVRFINRKNSLSGLNAYVMLILAIVFGIFPNAMQVDNVFISHLILLLSYRRLYSIKSNKNVKEKIFDFGFWVGVASMFYIWCSIFLILIFVTMIELKKKEIRNFIIPIVGFITPLFLVFTYYFMINGMDVFYDRLVFAFKIEVISRNVFIPFIILMPLLIIAIIYITIKMHLITTELKHVWIEMIINLLLAVIVFLVAPVKGNSSIIFLFFPLSIILVNFIELIPKMVRKEVIIIGLLILSFGRYFL